MERNKLNVCATFGVANYCCCYFWGSELLLLSQYTRIPGSSVRVYAYPGKVVGKK